ncbi:hypothetical protein [Knoellia koreensis]|nr:hypothetical protein [Knoellia sp. DB2414S]
MTRGGRPARDDRQERNFARGILAGALAIAIVVAIVVVAAQLG